MDRVPAKARSSMPEARMTDQDRIAALAAATDELGTSVGAGLYGRIKHELLFGEYGPGDKLKVEAIRKRFSVGANAVREALVKLTADGLVVAQDQKGFRVAAAGLGELRDLTRMRELLEIDGVGRSIDEGDLEWEGRVAAALRKLTRIEAEMLKGAARVEEWTVYDMEFHIALMSACGSALHLRIYKDQFIKFRQFVVRELKTHGFRGQDIIAEHIGIGEAALARDKEACLARLRRHVNTYLNRQTAAGG